MMMELDKLSRMGLWSKLSIVVEKSGQRGVNLFQIHMEKMATTFVLVMEISKQS